MLAYQAELHPAGQPARSIWTSTICDGLAEVREQVVRMYCDTMFEPYPGPRMNEWGKPIIDAMNASPGLRAEMKRGVSSRLGESGEAQVFRFSWTPASLDWWNNFVGQEGPPGEVTATIGKYEYRGWHYPVVIFNGNNPIWGDHTADSAVWAKRSLVRVYAQSMEGFGHGDFDLTDAGDWPAVAKPLVDAVNASETMRAEMKQDIKRRLGESSGSVHSETTLVQKDLGLGQSFKIKGYAHSSLLLFSYADWRVGKTFSCYNFGIVDLVATIKAKSKGSGVNVPVEEILADQDVRQLLKGSVKSAFGEAQNPFIVCDIRWTPGESWWNTVWLRKGLVPRGGPGEVSAKIQKRFIRGYGYADSYNEYRGFISAVQSGSGLWAGGFWSDISHCVSELVSQSARSMAGPDENKPFGHEVPVDPEASPIAAALRADPGIRAELKAGISGRLGEGSESEDRATVHLGERRDLIISRRKYAFARRGAAACSAMVREKTNRFPGGDEWIVVCYVEDKSVSALLGRLASGFLHSSMAPVMADLGVRAMLKDEVKAGLEESQATYRLLAEIAIPDHPRGRVVRIYQWDNNGFEFTMTVLDKVEPSSKYVLPARFAAYSNASRSVSNLLKTYASTNSPAITGISAIYADPAIKRALAAEVAGQLGESGDAYAIRATFNGLEVNSVPDPVEYRSAEKLRDHCASVWSVDPSQVEVLFDPARLGRDDEFEEDLEEMEFAVNFKSAAKFVKFMTDEVGDIDSLNTGRAPGFGWVDVIDGEGAQITFRIVPASAAAKAFKDIQKCLVSKRLGEAKTKKNEVLFQYKFRPDDDWFYENVKPQDVTVAILLVEGAWGEYDEIDGYEPVVYLEGDEVGSPGPYYADIIVADIRQAEEAVKEIVSEAAGPGAWPSVVAAMNASPGLKKVKAKMVASRLGEGFKDVPEPGKSHLDFPVYEAEGKADFTDSGHAPHLDGELEYKAGISLFGGELYPYIKVDSFQEWRSGWVTEWVGAAWPESRAAQAFGELKSALHVMVDWRAKPETEVKLDYESDKDQTRRQAFRRLLKKSVASAIGEADELPPKGGGPVQLFEYEFQTSRKILTAIMHLAGARHGPGKRAFSDLDRPQAARMTINDTRAGGVTGLTFSVLVESSGTLVFESRAFGPITAKSIAVNLVDVCFSPDDPRFGEAMKALNDNEPLKAATKLFLKAQALGALDESDRRPNELLADVRHGTFRLVLRAVLPFSPGYTYYTAVLFRQTHAGGEWEQFSARTLDHLSPVTIEAAAGGGKPGRALAAAAASLAPVQKHIRRCMKSKVKSALGEGMNTPKDAEKNHKLGVKLALDGFPADLVQYVVDGTIVLENTRPDGTLEFGIGFDLEPDTEVSQVVWHPPGAEQDYENDDIYVKTSSYRRGDLNDPLGDEVVASGAEDVEWWLADLHKI